MKKISKAENLEHEIFKMAEDCDNKKWSRVKKTFFIISAIMYLIEVYFIIKFGINNIDIFDILGFLSAPFVVAGFVIFISYGVLFYIINGAMESEKALAKKMGELNAIKLMEQEVQKVENAKNKEIENHLEDIRIMLAPVANVKEKLDFDDLKSLLKPIIDEYHLKKVKEDLENYAKQKH